MKTKLILVGANGRMGQEISALAAPKYDIISIDPNGQADFASIQDFMTATTTPSANAATPPTGGVGATTQASPVGEGNRGAVEGFALIDVSHHTMAAEIAAFVAEHKIPAVIATTGYTETELAAIRTAAREAPLFQSGNTSIGAALLVDLAHKAASVMENADIEIIETHHNTKLDAPSGTALMLADSIRRARPELTPKHGRSGIGKREPNELGIHSLRTGNVIGDHEVVISTPTQTITLTHHAHSRTLFAEGALAALEFILGQAPGLYGMADLI